MVYHTTCEFETSNPSHWHKYILPTGGTQIPNLAPHCDEHLTCIAHVQHNTLHIYELLLSIDFKFLFIFFARTLFLVVNAFACNNLGARKFHFRRKHDQFTMVSFKPFFPHLLLFCLHFFTFWYLPIID